MKIVSLFICIPLLTHSINTKPIGCRVSLMVKLSSCKRSMAVRFHYPADYETQTTLWVSIVKSQAWQTKSLGPSRWLGHWGVEVQTEES